LFVDPLVDVLIGSGVIRLPLHGLAGVDEGGAEDGGGVAGVGYGGVDVGGEETDVVLAQQTLALVGPGDVSAGGKLEAGRGFDGGVGVSPDAPAELFRGGVEDVPAFPGVKCLHERIMADLRVGEGGGVGEHGGELEGPA
jgi:hypothetical protein